MCEDDDNLATTLKKVVGSIEKTLKDNAWTSEQLRNESTSEVLKKEIAETLA